MGLQSDHVCATVVGARIATRTGSALNSIEVYIVGEIRLGAD